MDGQTPDRSRCRHPGGFDQIINHSNASADIPAHEQCRLFISADPMVQRPSDVHCEDFHSEIQGHLGPITCSQQGSPSPLDSPSRSLPQHPRDGRRCMVMPRIVSPPPDAPSTHRPVSSRRHMPRQRACDRQSGRQLVRCHASSPVAANEQIVDSAISVPTSASG